MEHSTEANVWHKTREKGGVFWAGYENLIDAGRNAMAR